jgi:protein kinase-like protein
VTTQPTDPRLGTDLGSYHLEAVVGRGGMGVVYRASDRSLDRPVALKLIAPTVADDEAFRSRFLRESKMAAAIDHPNIIPIYEAGEAGGSYFLAMRFVDGTDLERRLRDGPLEPRAALAIIGQIASALDAAHSAGLVHRDVKPANVLIASGQGADRSDHAYLTDFGLTKQSGSETGLTRSGGFVGTLEYIAPEQIEGRAADGRADQYALAAIAVAALTGEVPFPRDSDVAIINAHLHDAPPSLRARVPTLPAAVDAAIARGMAKDPADRYPDCRSFVEDLAWALGITSTRPEVKRAAADGRVRRWVPLVAAALAIGVFAIIAAAMAAGRPEIGNTSPSPSALAAVGPPSASAPPSPTEDVFPNARESALLALLPDGLAASCSRGIYDVVDADPPRRVGGVPGQGGSARTPLASVLCTPAFSGGANSVLVRQFPVSEGGASGAAGGALEFNTESVIAARAIGRQAPAGDCASSAFAIGSWSVGATDRGALFCYTDASNGDAVLLWSYQDAQVLVVARNSFGDPAALYHYFTEVARFIAP